MKREPGFYWCLHNWFLPGRAGKTEFSDALFLWIDENRIERNEDNQNRTI